MVSAELQVTGGKHAGQVIPLNRKKFLIGREQDCQLRPNSEMVSRHHCVFSIDDYSVRLRDLGSTNGTFVNGERIRKEVVLQAGDEVVIGNLEFRLGLGQAEVIDAADSADSATNNEETVVGDAGTLPEIPATPVGSDSQAGVTPGQPAPEDATQILPTQQPMMPGQVPYQPQMMPPMGYPGGMYGYGYQPMMPGYPQMYPQMMPGMGMYPQQQPWPQQGQGEAPQQPQQQPGGGGDVALPDPSTTGAAEEGAPKGSGGANKSETEKPTGAADAIIKQYMGRRPASR